MLEKEQMNGEEEEEEGEISSTRLASEETIYLCNFRVSVDGEWLCLKELENENSPTYSNIETSDNDQDLENVSYPIYGPKDRDPILIERSNLVNILKLVIKEIIDSSLRFGRQLDSDHIPLQHFFIVLEHVLRHGLRPKKGLLGPKKELWDILQLVEKRDSDAADITASVRDLPTVRTHTGRARAWLRLALMQKKLAEYFRILIDYRHKDEDLAEYYEPQALLRSEEAVIVTGLLVSLNVVDCNLCVKEEDLDSQRGVIDFSLYLRNKADSSISIQDGSSTEDSIHPMSAVLDQKNYIEELNRHLNATVTNLESKVESLTTTNALIKEDLAICKNSLFRAEEENRKLLNQLEKSAIDRLDMDKSSLENKSSSSSSNNSDTRLQEEMMKSESLQRELNQQVRLKEEMEMAVKLLEKDIHEKQDTIISLRDQLEDIKNINLEMYTKLQECEESLKRKSEMIVRLESKTSKLDETLQKLNDKHTEMTLEKRMLEEKVSTFHSKADTELERIRSLEADLKIEREWRIRLQRDAELSERKIEALHQDVEFLRKVANDYDVVRNEQRDLNKLLEEKDRTMEELGLQLSQSKLQVDKMKEEKAATQTWQDDDDVTECGICTKEFNLTRRKHHCRNCGKIFCHDCSNNKMKLVSFIKPARVCDACYTSSLDGSAANDTAHFHGK